MPPSCAAAAPRHGQLPLLLQRLLLPLLALRLPQLGGCCCCHGHVTQPSLLLPPCAGTAAAATHRAAAPSVGPTAAASLSRWLLVDHLSWQLSLI